MHERCVVYRKPHNANGYLRGHDSFLIVFSKPSDQFQQLLSLLLRRIRPALLNNTKRLMNQQYLQTLHLNSVTVFCFRILELLKNQKRLSSGVNRKSHDTTNLKALEEMVELLGAEVPCKFSQQVMYVLHNRLVLSCLYHQSIYSTQ